MSGTDEAAYRAQLLATAKAAAVPVVSEVAAGVPPDELAGLTADELRALVIVLAEAAGGDMPRLRAIAGADDDLGAETAYDLIAPDFDDAGFEFHREAGDALDVLAPTRALVLWECPELTDRRRPAVSEPAGAAAA
jgi:hypothetical protein